MTLTQLEYLIAIANYKGFGEAAKHCFVSQPSLSIQIKKLEEELGIIIFDRSKKPLLVTEVGQIVVDQAREVLREAKKIGDLVQIQEDKLEGCLHIGIIPTLSPYLTPLFIKNFIQKYPNIDILIEELISEEIIDKLNNDLLDVGILATPLLEPSLVEMPLFYELFVLYISTLHPLNNKSKIDFEDLDYDELWLLKRGHCFRNQSINICGQRYEENESRLRFESGSLETLRLIVEQEFGYTLLPELATLQMSDKQMQHVKYFKNPQPVREISLVRHRSFIKSKLVQLLKDELLQAIPEILTNKDRGKRVGWKV